MKKMRQRGVRMEENFEKIQRFLTACDELVNGTFHVAEGKISEALRALADSKDLTNLFSAVTSGYDYPAAKRAYLRFSNEDGISRGVAYLPSERREVLAFVFCLLVELDAGELRLNDFLLRYFYVDGSYTASYAVFAERMIKPFRDIVRDCYPDCGRRGRLARIHKKRDAILGEIAEKLAEERARIQNMQLLQEEQEAAEALFPALIAAAGRRDAPEVLALLAGYRYFLRYINAESGTSAAVFALAAEL